MPADRPSQRIVIAGASSLLGAEVKSLLEESRFAGWDISLVDEEIVAGTLTEAAGEATVIQPMEEGTFDRARLIFFSGSPAFVERNREAAELAVRSGSVILDFTGKFWTKDLAAAPYFPKLAEFWGIKTPNHSNPLEARPGGHFWILSAAGMAGVSLSFGLRDLGLKHLTIIFFRPVSEAGRAGIEELESQTGQLLSFQNVGAPVFDTQVAFNMLDRYGPASQQNLEAARRAIREEVCECVTNQGAVMPSIQVLHVPTFYGMTFIASAQLDPAAANSQNVGEACQKAGFSILQETDAGPSNISAAGETSIRLGVPQCESNEAIWWFWGAADNIRLPAWNAVKLAEKVIA
jgi:aspartate-semialdehyde dehydrogenase